MSRVGKQPIDIPDKVEVRLDKSLVRVKGPLGELTMNILPEIKVEQKEKRLVVSLQGSGPRGAALFGMSRARIANLVTGVHQGFKKDLEIQGVGYRAQVSGKMLVLTLGFSHPVNFPIPDGIKIETDKKAVKLSVSGIDKELVGETAAQLRALKKPEPYKGTGIRYADERVRRKAGKTAAGASGGKK